MIQTLKLPAGLLDNDSEFFGTSSRLYELRNGIVKEVSLSSGVFYELLLAETKSNKSVSKALDLLNLTTDESRVGAFYDCNYSSFDASPDLIDRVSLGEPEYIKCGQRGACPHEGLLCKLPFNLTKKEARILKLIGEGFLDKEICDLAFISQSTLRYHKDKISQKTQTTRKTELARTAIKIGLI